VSAEVANAWFMKKGQTPKELHKITNISETGFWFGDMFVNWDDLFNQWCYSGDFYDRQFCGKQIEEIQ